METRVWVAPNVLHFIDESFFEILRIPWCPCWRQRLVECITTELIVGDHSSELLIKPGEFRYKLGNGWDKCR